MNSTDYFAAALIHRHLHHVNQREEGQERTMEEKLKRRIDEDDQDDGDGSLAKKKCHKKKRKHCINEDDLSLADCMKKSQKKEKKKKKIKLSSAIVSVDSKRHFPFEYQYILAPMVGASELAFRLLCRKYGAQLCYTPMMVASRFASDPAYRQAEFQTIPQDRPLVCHFCANDPQDFANAAQIAQPFCDAIDLNLGCPQRTAYIGHYGSYLLNAQDRALILDIVRAGSQAVSIPIFCKIRLLDTVQETIQLCQQLRDAGASLIAIHARYRASYERNGPGARDGPALLDQVLEVKKAMPDFPIIANGNIITYQDVCNNLKFTTADGVMSAEGILDNPALYLPRFRETNQHTIQVHSIASSTSSSVPRGSSEVPDKSEKELKKLSKKLREIEALEQKRRNQPEIKLSTEEMEKISKKEGIQQRLNDLSSQSIQSRPTFTTQMCSLQDLETQAQDKLRLATEYLSLVQLYPVKIRSIIFHIRRILKQELNQYQLMEDCVACGNVDQIYSVLQKMIQYKKDPISFTYDVEKAKRDKEALEMKRREEGKRKEYEARMIRKAKREGKEDIEFYLRQGTCIPAWNEIQQLKSLPREQQLQAWKLNNHSQHCMAYHLQQEGCPRGDRACCFLHVDAKQENSFVEGDEMAG